MGINHQADFHISRHTPISFSDKRMKEECGAFEVHDDATVLSSDCFHVTGSQTRWGLPTSETSAPGQSSAAAVAEANCQEAPRDRNCAPNPIRKMQALQFAEPTTGQKFTGQARPYLLKNCTKLKIDDSKLMFSPQIDSSSLQSGLDRLPSHQNVKSNDNYNGHYSEEYINSAAHPTDQDQGWPLLGVSKAKELGNLGACHDASCMEQLLIHCASALESNDVTLAQQIMWVLNNIASAEGDPNQRVTSCFLRALIARTAKMGTPNVVKAMAAAPVSGGDTKKLSAIELAGFVDLTPWHRFGFSAANGAIAEAVEGHTTVHILDFGITHCMQWPTLIETLSKKFVRIFQFSPV